MRKKGSFVVVVVVRRPPLDSGPFFLESSLTFSSRVERLDIIIKRFLFHLFLL